MIIAIGADGHAGASTPGAKVEYYFCAVRAMLLLQASGFLTIAFLSRQLEQKKR